MVFSLSCTQESSAEVHAYRGSAAASGTANELKVKAGNGRLNEVRHSISLEYQPGPEQTSCGGTGLGIRVLV